MDLLRLVTLLPNFQSAAGRATSAEYSNQMDHDSLVLSTLQTLDALAQDLVSGEL